MTASPARCRVVLENPPQELVEVDELLVSGLSRQTERAQHPREALSRDLNSSTVAQSSASFAAATARESRNRASPSPTLARQTAFK